MRVRLERYEAANRSAQTRSLLAFVFGGAGVVIFGFLTFFGFIMFLMPNEQGGGLYARRAGIVVGLFLGAMPTAISTLLIVWGAKKRARFRRLAGLAAIARQTPVLTTSQIAQALRLTPADADGLLVEASGLGLIDDSQASPGAMTTAPAAPTAPSHPSARPGSSSDAPIARITPGTVLGGAYRIEEPLGRGGMGEVHAARHLRTGRRYAVKTILPGAHANEASIRRFEREATAASALGHPGIVQVHDFNVTPGGLFYLVMDLLEGETLEARLERVGALPWPEAQRIAVELCAALGAAHEHGLLHRDLKPGNVFLAKHGKGAERTVLVDFGLVKPMEESSAVTSTGAVVGTPMYMSPEQARGEALDVRSDLYSLAAVVFEMITGAPPFLDRSMAAVYARLLAEPPPRASQVAKRAIPRAVDDVLVRALEKDRGARFPDARSLGDALSRIEGEAPGPATERMVN
jgi:tRNA A-37 threonylcarbamoyl transferase component Bud32